MIHDIPQSPSSSTCADSVRWVSQSRDGELSANEQRRLDEHLAICKRCQVARRQFSALFTGLDELLAR